MPRDYKHRAQKKPAKKPLPGWLWLVTGLLLGGFIVGLAWLNGQATDSGGDWVGAQPDHPPQGTVRAKPRVEVPEPPQPRFDFYSMLPKMEVEVPDVEFEKELAQPTTGAPSTYLLQLGSFRRDADADRLRAQLALLGFEAHVARAQIAPHDTRYRVRTGPYEGKQALEQARQRLAGNGFPGLVIRLER